MSADVYSCAITPEVRTYELRSITWGQHVAWTVGRYSIQWLTANKADRRSIKLWHACRNQDRARSRLRRAYWRRQVGKIIRSIDNGGR